MGSPERGHRLAAAGFSALLLILSLIAAELFVRWLDGYRVASVRLSAEQSLKIISADPFVARLPVADGMSREWFQLSPQRVTGSTKPAPNLSEVIARYVAAGIGSESEHVFSRGFVDATFCTGDAFRRLHSVFLFDAPDGGRYPRYRFPLNSALYSGLVTNQFGWRGPPIELAKAPRTIRLAFLGASTTVNNHGFPFSYPELSVFWLNKWAKALNLGVEIELINAAREGAISTDMAAVARDEVLPLEPDLVVYYEGSNQLDLGYLARFPGGVLPVRGEPGATADVRRYFAGAAAMVAPYSAVFTRLANALGDVGEVAEPQKPAYEAAWPHDVDEFDPPLGHARLPSNLTTILHDLDDIRTHVAGQGGELVVSSFFWLAWDGMKLNLPRQKTIFDSLNTTYWPYRYRELERIAAFQNRVFEKFARTNNLPFIDVASSIPREPDLFDDGIHAKYEGVRLHAWIAAQQLAPILLKRIRDNVLPRPARLKLDRHPGFPANERTVVFECDGKSFQEKQSIAGIVAPP
jgi:hypothetical protein